MCFGGFDVLEDGGLEPLAVMRQAGKAVLLERFVPEDFNCKFSIGSIPQNTWMQDPNAGDNVRCFPLIPVKCVARFDKKMVFTLVMPDGFGLGLREEQKVHIRIIPITSQAVQRAFLCIRPEDVAVDGEEGVTPQKRKRLFQSAARFLGFSLF